MSDPYSSILISCVSCLLSIETPNSAKMLVSSPKYLGTFLTFFALIILILTRRHAAEHSLGKKAIGFTYEPSDQTVIEGGMMEPQELVVYDKFSRDTPSDIEANWAATIAAKNLLQKVREFRHSAKASYNGDSKKSVRKALEDAEFELKKLGKESFNTKKIVQGVRKLKAALKAAEETITQSLDAETVTSKFAEEDSAAALSGKALQEAEADRKSKEKVASLERLQKAELDAVIADSKESPDSTERPFSNR